MTRTISPGDFAALLERKDVLVIDVRRKADYEADSQAIPGAVWRNPEEVQHLSERLPRDKEIVVYGVCGGLGEQRHAGPSAGQGPQGALYRRRHRGLEEGGRGNRG